MMQILLPLIGPIIDKVLALIPNSNERAKAKEELERTLLEAANAAALAQIEVNKAEAAHRSVFVAGWRPWIGWVCGFSLAWQFIAYPLATWACAIWFPAVTLPALDVGPLANLVTAMLGLAGLRTFEKSRGLASA